VSGTSGNYTEQAYVDSGLQTQADRVYDNVQANVPGVLLPVVQMELWNTVQEFCRLSTYFRVELNFNLAVGQQLLDFNPYSSEMEVFTVLGLKSLGMQHYRIDPPALLINTGDTSQPITGWVLAALKPTNFGYLPPILFDLWFEAMLSGTLARLYAAPMKPYTNPQMASVNMGKFRAEVRRARDQAERFNSSQQSGWRFPYFAWGVRKN
jgi:hypothetical protein